LAKGGSRPEHSGGAARWEEEDAKPESGRIFPADLLDRADAAAMVLGVSRSKFVCIALCDFLVRHNSNEETRQLNKYYIKHPSEPDPFLDYLALETMKRTEWEE
jgi:hypothetical protein